MQKGRLGLEMLCNNTQLASSVLGLCVLQHSLPSTQDHSKREKGADKGGSPITFPVPGMRDFHDASHDSLSSKRQPRHLFAYRCSGHSLALTLRNTRASIALLVRVEADGRCILFNR